MEELVAVLLGTGAVVFSPFLIPGLRPIAKSAIKGSMAVADAAKGVAVATSEGCRDAVNKASAALKPATKTEPAEAAESEESAAGATVSSAETSAEAPQPDQPAGQAAAPGAINVKPIVDAIVGYGQVAVDAAAGILAQAGKQWNQIVADAQAERKAEALGHDVLVHEVQPLQAPVPAAVPVAAAEAPTPASADIVVSVSEAGPDVSAQADDLEQIDGIGPKVAAVLREAGITTFEQLAATDSDQLRAILISANPRYRIFDPTSWPVEAQRFAEASPLSEATARA